MPAATPALTGGCLCGGVRFELAVRPEVAGYCHCTRCQRRTGGAASAQAFIDDAALTFVAGEELVDCWRPPEGMEKCYCRDCGAHLFSRDPASGAYRTIRMGAFDDDPGVALSFRQHLASAASWEPIPDDGMARFDGRRPG